MVRLKLLLRKLIRDRSEYCRRCGGDNVIWSGESPLWNFVMRENDINGPIRYSDLVCMACFIQLALERGVSDRGWRLYHTNPPDDLIYETPSGRVWNPHTFLWDEPIDWEAEARGLAEANGDEYG